MESREMILQAINEYLMDKFEYKTPPAHLGLNKSTIDARRKKVDLYLRMIEFSGGLWDTDTFVIARIGFQEERKGHGTDFLRFLTNVLPVQYKYIGIECVNENSSQFAERLGFKPHKSDNDYIITISDLKSRFQE